MNNSDSSTSNKLFTLLWVALILVLAFLPIIFNNYQKKVVAANLRTAYANFGNILNMSELVNDSKDNWNYKKLTEDEFAKKYLLPFIKKVKVIEEKPPVIRPLGSKSRVSAGTDGFDKYYVLPNGTFFTILLPEDSEKEVLEINVYIKEKGKNKSYTMGRDAFKFVISHDNVSKKFKPYSSTENRNLLLKKDYTSEDGLIDNCSKSKDSDYAGNSCGYLIMMDGWKIKNDYPW